MAQEYFISTGPQPAAVVDEGLGAAAHALPRAVADRGVRQLLVHRSPRARPHRGRSLGEPADEHAAPPGLLADLLHARRGSRRATPLPWDCSPCTTAGLQDDAGLLRRRPDAGLDGRLQGAGGSGLPDRRRALAAGQGLADGSAADTTGVVPKLPARSGRRGTARRRRQRLRARRSTISGWACDPEWSGATVAVRIYGGAPREQTGGTLLGEVRADQALATPLAREVSAACDGPGRDYARHGVLVHAAERSGRQRVRVRDRRGDRRRAGGAAHADPQRHRARSALRSQRARRGRGAVRRAAAPAPRASAATAPHGDCCSVAWTDECAAAADSCARDRQLGAGQQPLVRGGDDRLDRGAGDRHATCSKRRSSRAVCSSTARRCSTGSRPRPGPPADRSPCSAGSSTTFAGIASRSASRRRAAEPGPDLAAARDGRPGRDPVGKPLRDRARHRHGSDRDLLHGRRLRGRVSSRAPTRTSTSTRTSRRPDRRRWTCPPVTVRRTRRIWEGEIVPSFTEDYTFYVVGSGHARPSPSTAPRSSFAAAPASSAPGGCAHDLCTLGDKLDASCNSCVHDICAQGSVTAATAGTSRTTRSSPSGTRAASPRSRRTARGSKCAPPPPPPGLAAEEVGRACRCRRACTTRSGSSTATRPPTRRSACCGRARARPKQAVPQFALYPRGASPTERRRRPQRHLLRDHERTATVKPDLGSRLAGGAGQRLLADADDRPARHAARRRAGDAGRRRVGQAVAARRSCARATARRCSSTAAVTVHVTGIGGISGRLGAHHRRGGAGDVVVAGRSERRLRGGRAASRVGAHTLKLVQQTYAAQPVRRARAVRRELHGRLADHGHARDARRPRRP